jgi:hypothetical protein
MALAPERLAAMVGAMIEGARMAGATNFDIALELSAHSLSILGRVDLAAARVAVADGVRQGIQTALSGRKLDV